MSQSLMFLRKTEGIAAELSCLYLSLKGYWLWFFLRVLSSKTKPSRPLGAVLPASKGHCQFCMLILCDCSLINLQLCRASFAHTDIQKTSFVLNMVMGIVVRWKELLFWFECLISSVLFQTLGHASFFEWRFSLCLINSEAVYTSVNLKGLDFSINHGAQLVSQLLQNRKQNQILHWLLWLYYKYP